MKIEKNTHKNNVFQSLVSVLNEIMTRLGERSVDLTSAAVKSAVVKKTKTNATIQPKATKKNSTTDSMFESSHGRVVRLQTERGEISGIDNGFNIDGPLKAKEQVVERNTDEELRTIAMMSELLEIIYGNPLVNQILLKKIDLFIDLVRAKYPALLTYLPELSKIRDVIYADLYNEQQSEAAITQREASGQQRIPNQKFTFEIGNQEIEKILKLSMEELRVQFTLVVEELAKIYDTSAEDMRKIAEQLAREEVEKIHKDTGHGSDAKGKEMDIETIQKNLPAIHASLNQKLSKISPTSNVHLPNPRAYILCTMIGTMALRQENLGHDVISSCVKKNTGTKHVDLLKSSSMENGMFRSIK